MIDLIIVGAGVSALTAGIYAARDGLKVQIFEKEIIGGIISSSEFVENYPGFDEGISGVELSKKIRKQAEKFGVKIEYGEVSQIEDLGDFVRVCIDGKYIETRTVLIASGSYYRKLDLPREDDFIGKGIHFCATCDGPFYTGKNIVTVGGGDAGTQEALFLSRFAKVKTLIRSKITAQEVLRARFDEAVKDGRIEVFMNTEIKELLIREDEGSERIYGVKVKQKKGDSIQEFNLLADGVFEFIGLIPNTKFLKDSQVDLNSLGEIIVDESLRTSSPNIFACGDVIEDSEKQLVIAAGSGAKAAIHISKILHG